MVAYSGKYYECLLEYLSGHKQSQTTKHVISTEKFWVEGEILVFNYYSLAASSLQAKSGSASV